MSSFLRFLELLGAAILIGGLAATAAVGQLAFHSPDILSREQAGRFMAEVFEGSIYVELGAVGLMLVASLLRRVWPIVTLVLLSLAIVAGHGFLTKGMHDVRLKHGGTLVALEAGDPDRVSFGRMHGLYALLSVGLLGTSIGVVARHARKQEKSS